jgi:hypothetical protein
LEFVNRNAYPLFAQKSIKTRSIQLLNLEIE